MIREVAVVVPAADEQEHIAACLESITEAGEQLLESGSGVERLRVIAVLDGCVDETPAIVARLAAESPVQVIITSVRRVGAARQRGTLAALSTRVSPTQLWLANTDADSVVPRSWLTEMVQAANEGADVVLGTVLPGAELPQLLRAAWLARHTLVDGHPHVHGANLGIRGDAYIRLGGWNPNLACNEDTDLASRATASSHVHVRCTAAIPVVTSARMTARAPNGFSSYIRHLREERLRPLTSGALADAQGQHEAVVRV